MSAKPKISDRCPSCKKKWVNHMGTIHVCRQLQEAMAIIRSLLEDTPKVSCDCFHHKKEDRHKFHENCNPTQRFLDAATKANQFISGKP